MFLPVHDRVNRAEEDGERLIVKGEDERGLVKFPYLSSVHDGVNRVEKDGERLIVEGEDDGGLVKFPYLSMME